MMNARIAQVLIWALGLLPLGLRAQIGVDTSVSIKQLVSEKLLGNRVKVRDIRYAGSELSRAYFRDETDFPLIGEGIMLSTGSVFDAIGPNKAPSMGQDLNRRGDRALQYIGRGPTFDAAMLEFDFMPQLDFISFNFVFASEEYTEYVNSQFNDVFAFYISGPGITGTKNLAVVPSNGAPITVNTVNHIFNTANYIDNDRFGKRGQTLPGKESELDQGLFQNYEFDGFTTLLRAETNVIPGEVYHIRICIADVGDHRYDSAVFLEGKSFSSYPRDAQKRAAMMAQEMAGFRRKSPPVAVGQDPLLGDSIPVTPPVAKTDTVPAPTWTKADLAPVKGNPWRFEFAFDSHTLTHAHKATLDTVALYLQKNPKARLRIEGHTDNVGTAGYNDRLSLKRAESVQNFLIEKGIPKSRTETGHYGYDRPKESNAAETGRARNRRVEIILLK